MIRIRRPVRDTVPAPYHKKLGRFEGNVDRWFTYDFQVPGILLLDAGVKPTGTPDDDLSEALRFHSCQAITPPHRTTFGGRDRRGLDWASKAVTRPDRPGRQPPT